jgi:hypothetical protein
VTQSIDLQSLVGPVQAEGLQRRCGVKGLGAEDEGPVVVGEKRREKEREMVCKCSTCVCDVCTPFS